LNEVDRVSLYCSSVRIFWFVFL